jgi:hypothetical protein
LNREFQHFCGDNPRVGASFTPQHSAAVPAVYESKKYFAFYAGEDFLQICKKIEIIYFPENLAPYFSLKYS